LITLVYRMEGDGLLVLLARSEIEAALAWGETVGDDQSSLPNVAAVLRKNTTLKVLEKLSSTAEILEATTLCK